MNEDIEFESLDCETCAYVHRNLNEEPCCSCYQCSSKYEPIEKEGQAKEAMMNEYV